jgi:hypothetical protein
MALFAGQACAGNYTLTVDGKAFEIDEGGTITATTKSGAEVEISLARKEFSTFLQPPVSFEHPGDLSVAKTTIDAGINQYLLATASGTVLLIQHYETFNPATLAETMIAQLSREKISAGATMNKEPLTRTLSDGTVMTGLQAVLTTPAEDVLIEVAAIDKGYGGVLAVTYRDRKMEVDESAIVDRFWHTLNVNAGG